MKNERYLRMKFGVGPGSIKVAVAKIAIDRASSLAFPLLIEITEEDIRNELISMGLLSRRQLSIVNDDS
jgi:hypothetical protein